jgi:hypothetical protein
MARSTITRRTRTYLHPLRIAPPGMRPTGPELPWLEEIGPHRPSSHGLTLALALLVIALLVPMRNAHAVKAVSSGSEAPEKALEEPDGSWAERFGLPGVFHAGCLESLVPESPVQLSLPTFSGAPGPIRTTRSHQCGATAAFGIPSTG